MKSLALLSLSVLPASAQIFADVSTTLGDFSIELYYADSPKAVANFITLAEGTRAWVDSATGEVRSNTPYYDGIIFHRVIYDFMNQAGSQNGQGTDGPGYNIPDEVGNGLLHDEPYLLSAANSGPNTNGSQFFTTVVPTPWLDGIHTVYGKIVTGTDTIDTINETPVNGSRPVTPVTIESVTIRRVGAEAEAFDEFAQGLPTVTAVSPGQVTVQKNQELALSIKQPPGTTLNVFRSNNLQTWTNGQPQYVGAGDSPLNDYLLGPPQQREFLRTNLVQWPADAAFPGSLLGETITIDGQLGNDDATISLVLTDPGTLTVTFDGGDPIIGNIDYSQSFFSHDGYGATMVIETAELVAFRFRLGADVPMTSPLTGNVTGAAFTFPSQTSISGTFEVEP